MDIIFSLNVTIKRENLNDKSSLNDGARIYIEIIYHTQPVIPMRQSADYVSMFHNLSSQLIIHQSFRYKV